MIRVISALLLVICVNFCWSERQLTDDFVPSKYNVKWNIDLETLDSSNNFTGEVVIWGELKPGKNEIKLFSKNEIKEENTFVCPQDSQNCETGSKLMCC